MRLDLSILSLVLIMAPFMSFAEPLVIEADRPNEITFPTVKARFVRFLIHRSSSGQPCIDELEVYGPKGEQNMALAKNGAKATASSCLSGYSIHQITHLNDGRFGNSHSWIAAGHNNEWVQIELAQEADVAKVVFSRDRQGRFMDRLPVDFDIQVSINGKQWETVKKIAADPFDLETWDDKLSYAFQWEKKTYWSKGNALSGVLKQMEEMIGRFAARGLDVKKERLQLAELRDRELGEEGAESRVYLEARLAKRKLFLRDPELAPLQKILFVKRHPFRPSHNYSVILDSKFRAGGGVCRLDVPLRDGRLEPGEAQVVELFKSGGGIARTPMANFRANKIYFSYISTPSNKDYFRIMEMNADGSDLKQLTSGPFHDFWPCPLPDGGLAFISTRCKGRFICWRPQAFVLFRMDTDGKNIRPLSYANLSEWAPTVMSDGRIIWTRSEYIDKGADFGHTLWSIQPDGTHPELVFGNNTPNCYANGRQVPGTQEISCTLISHAGDLNGPIALIDTSKGRFNPEAITNITPDVSPRYNMNRTDSKCFRDPVPISKDYFLCSHSPQHPDIFGIYVVDRFGNRELIYLDQEISSVCPTPFRAVTPPPKMNNEVEPQKEGQKAEGLFTIADVYRGLEPAIKRGRIKYLRVCQELRPDLIQLPNGEYQKDHPDFRDYYATPIHKVSGPYGWPSYSAKATFGTVPIEEDGSASFFAPSGKVLYFQVLDENYNELQRMRSVVQLQPGEKRSCIGCHEDRNSSPPVRKAIALRQQPRKIQAPPWGAGPFSYEKIVQPVWDAKCITCHNTEDKVNLSGKLDQHKVPASYRTLISQGWVHYFDCQWKLRHSEAKPATFGTVKSKLWKVLDAGHYDVKLSIEEMRRVKCWTDLNCPLWPDYIYRFKRGKGIDVVGTNGKSVSK